MKKLLNVLLVLSAVSAVVPAQAMTERGQRAHNRTVIKQGQALQEWIAQDDAENAQAKQIALTKEESNTIDTQALIRKGAKLAFIAALVYTAGYSMSSVLAANADIVPSCVDMSGLFEGTCYDGMCQITATPLWQNALSYMAGVR